MANRVILIGRTGKEPELTFTQAGLAICKFTLATSESFKDKSGNRTERTEWHNVVAFGKTGEIIREHIGKGQQIYIEGKIHYNKWQDKDGQNRISTEIVVDRFEFIGSKPRGGAGSGGAAYLEPLSKQEDIPF